MSMQPRHGYTALMPAKDLRVTFWGTRGSCSIFPAPHEVEEFTRQVAVYSIVKALQDFAARSQAAGGKITIEDLLGGPMTQGSMEAYQHKLGLPNLPIYGGETTCIEVETSEGNVIILDAGSGIRHCALRLFKRWETRADRTVHLFFSHEHLDHRNGLAFSRFCFANPPFNIKMYGTGQILTALDTLLGIFSRDIAQTTHFDDPLDYRLMAAQFTGTELRDESHIAGIMSHKPRPWEVQDIAQSVRIGKTVVTAFPVYHGACPCLGYRIQHGDSSFVFCTDHERRHGTDPDDPRQKASLAAEERLLTHCQNANVAYFDGQYHLAEYLGQKGIGSSPPISRLDWGHSCIEDVINRVQRANIKHAYVGHHDPDREWPEQMQMDRDLEAMTAGKPYKIELARGDTTIEV
jgi:phosphoribosyl 1,2-cyclic phosphodiesterase